MDADLSPSCHISGAKLALSRFLEQVENQLSASPPPSLNRLALTGQQCELSRPLEKLNQMPIEEAEDRPYSIVQSVSASLSLIRMRFPNTTG
jgi:hypothetical protein